MAKRNKVTVTRARESEKPMIIQQLTIRPVNRSVLEIEDWRNAIKAAEAMIPRKTQLLDQYDDILLDGHLSGVIRKFVAKIKNADWRFGKDGKINKKVKKIMDTPEFGKLLTCIVMSDFKGEKWATANNFTENGFSFYEVPQKHIRPHLGIVAKEQSGDTGISINEGIIAKELMKFGEGEGLGRLMIVAQYVIYKRGGFGDWSQFAEIFGMPFRKGTYDGYDESQRVLLEEALDKSGSAAYAVVPTGTNIEFVENKSNSDGAIYRVLKDACNQEMSVAILGNTETTTSSESSGYAQSKTHADSEDDLIKDALIRARQILNRYFIPVMESGGVSLEGGEFYIEGFGDEHVGKKDKLEMHLKIIEKLDLPYDPSHFYQTYDLPKPADYDAQMAERKKEIEAAKPVAEEKKPEEVEEPKPKKAKERKIGLADLPLIGDFLKTLGFFQAAQVPATWAEKKSCQCGEAHTITLSDAGIAGFDDDRLIKRVWEAGGNLSFDTALFHYFGTNLIRGLERGLHSKTINLVDMGFSYGANDPAMTVMFEMNLLRFSAAKTLAEAQKLNELFRRSTSKELFYLNAKMITDVYNKKWFETEVNTAILTGFGASNYARLMDSIDLYPYFKIVTAGDDDVRPSHQLLEGVILPGTDPIWLKLWTPFDWNCRCYIINLSEREVNGVDFDAMRKRVTDFMESDEFKKSVKAGFGVNRSVRGEVFTANQFYVDSFPGKTSKYLEELKPLDYGLSHYTEARKKAKEDLPVFEGKAEEFLSDNEVITDMHNRPVLLDNANYNRKEKGVDAYRSEYLLAVKETLKAPNEIWLNGKEYTEFATIKYYTDQTLVVVTNIKNGTVYQVEKWFPVDSDELIEYYRTGLLIFNKK